MTGALQQQEDAVKHASKQSAAPSAAHDDRVRAADPLLTAKLSAAEVGLSLPAFWRAVGAERLPAPIYPAPRAPRWRRSELHTALEATRALPARAKAARRAARLARVSA
jgi:predicted DNA-binding transcriptional regulator AlpA